MSKPNTLLSPNTNPDMGTFANESAQLFPCLNNQHDDTQENEMLIDLDRIQGTFVTPSKQFPFVTPNQSPYPTNQNTYYWLLEFHIASKLPPARISSGPSYLNQSTSRL